MQFTRSSEYDSFYGSAIFFGIQIKLFLKFIVRKEKEKKVEWEEVKDRFRGSKILHEMQLDFER